MQVNNQSLTQLQEQRGQLITQARAALDEIRGNTDDARAADLEARHDSIMGEVDRIDAQIEREQRVAAAEARQAELDNVVERYRAGRRPLVDGEGRGDMPGDDQITYRAAFHEYIRSAGALGDMRPEYRAVLQRGFQKIEHKNENRAQTTTAAAGGYTIPEEMMPELIRSLKAFGPMLDENVCTVITTTTGRAMPFPTVNDTSKEAGAHTEGVTLTDDGGEDVTFGEKQLDAYAFNTEWLRVARELADDSEFAMEALLNSLLGERLARKGNRELTVGTGSSAVNGIVTASTVGKTAAATNALTYDEILDLEHSVDPAYRVGPKVAYMMNDSTLLAVRKLKDGDGNYLWQAGNVQAGIPNLINGHPYWINQNMASLGAAAKVMLFGDLSKYFVRKVGLPLIGAIQDKDFWPGFGIAGYMRIDGELADTAAVKHLITAAS